MEFPQDYESLLLQEQVVVAEEVIQEDHQDQVVVELEIMQARVDQELLTLEVVGVELMIVHKVEQEVQVLLF